MPPPEQWGDVASGNYVKKLYSAFPKYPFSLAKARAELAKSAKYSRGFTASSHPDSQQTLGKAALSLVENLKQIGVTLNVKQVTTDEWFGALFAHKNLGAQIISWGVDYPDPADALHFIYDSQYATENAFNTANYKNAQMDKLLKIQQDSVNPKVRADAIANALKFSARDVPYIPIWYQQVAMALKSKYNYDFGTWYLYTPWVAGITASSDSRGPGVDAPGPRAVSVTHRPREPRSFCFGSAAWSSSWSSSRCSCSACSIWHRAARSSCCSATRRPRTPRRSARSGSSTMNDPFLVQYAKWAEGAVHLDFGTSTRTSEPVFRGSRSGSA